MGTHGHTERNNRMWEYKRWEGGRQVKVEKFPVGGNVHYLGGGYAKSADFTATWYMYVRNLHIYSLNIQQIFNK